MHRARWPAMHPLVTNHQMSAVVGCVQVNKFEQMSLAEGLGPV